MERLKSYIQSAWYNIRHHKMYALFCILGTALTFIFITLILQLTYSVSYNAAPFVNGDRIVHLSNSFVNSSGQKLGGIRNNEISSFIKNIKDEAGYALFDSQYGNILTGKLFRSGMVTFVNAGYWEINQFKFIEGRPFTQKECEAKKPVAVVKKYIAENYFRNNKIIGENIEFQGTKYTIIGIVEDYSSFVMKNMESMWVPSEFNQFVPNNRQVYDIHILFAENVLVPTMKKQIDQAVRFHFKNKNQEVEISPDKIYTIQEEKVNHYGNKLLTYGIPAILFLLLLIPAINIITLSIANINNRAQEVAIRRAMGANRLNSFIQIVIENLLLVFMGTFVGLLLTYPVADLIEKQFLSGGLSESRSFVPHLDYGVIFGAVIPLSIVFSLLSGGIPAYLISKRNIAETLKGGSK